MTIVRPELTDALDDVVLLGGVWEIATMAVPPRGGLVPIPEVEDPLEVAELARSAEE